ncbi:MAG: hypothetical protein V3U87_17855 [Methylococcaceae bacterium]
MIDLRRLNGFDPKKPTYFQMNDAVDAMADRALGSINLLQNNFLDENHFKVPDSVIVNALEGICLEILDIKKVTKDFYKSQRKEEKQKI